ncbi:hypothetical protein BR93DRAFT_930655 [Coniochaeta sp. PMI_546]|nr:hypothetical protein BR93DRAFT_930655 [Coniochaeta sp. PMI_546]
MSVHNRNIEDRWQMDPPQLLNDPLPLTIKIRYNNVGKYFVPAVRTDMGFKELQEQIDHRILTSFVGCDNSTASFQAVKESSTVSVYIRRSRIPLDYLESDQNLWKCVLEAALADLVDRVTHDLDKKERSTQKNETDGSAVNCMMAPTSEPADKSHQEEDEGRSAKRQGTGS